MTALTQAENTTKPRRHDDLEPAATFPDRLAGLASWRVWIVSAAVFVPFALVFFTSSAPFSIPEVEAACGAAPLDVRVFTNGDGVVDFLDGCGPSGRDAYTNMQIADIFYPAAVGIFLASSLALTLKGFSGHAAVRWLVALPLLASGFDYLENIFAWLALTSYPDPIVTNHLLGFASAAKTTTSWVGGIVLLVSLGYLITQRGRRVVRSAFGASSGASNQQRSTT